MCSGLLNVTVPLSHPSGTTPALSVRYRPEGSTSCPKSLPATCWVEETGLRMKLICIDADGREASAWSVATGDGVGACDSVRRTRWNDLPLTVVGSVELTVKWLPRWRRTSFSGLSPVYPA